MAGSRRLYSAEFKREAVRLTNEPGSKVSEVAANLGIDRSMLWRWRVELRHAPKEAFPGKGRKMTSNEEIERLRRELARTIEEREILKKALAFFANHRS